MRYKLTLPRLFVFVLLFFCIAVWALTDYYLNLPERLSQHETIVLGQSRLVPGSEAALRVVVRDSSSQEPLEQAAVKVSFVSDADGGGSPVVLFEGTIDDLGTTDVVFDVPDDVEGDQTLIVETESRLGSDRVERAVTLERDYRVLLTTDKPLYQPGQVIHVRALALSTFDRLPATEQPLEIVIADGKGNKVFRETVTTSEFGVSSTDFQLASQVNTGPYKITAQLGNASSEKTVTVERYVLPKFAVNLASQRPYYLPGERVEGTLNSAYFFGKPVANGSVELEGFTFDVERNVVLNLEGTTDAEGHFEFAFDLPDYIAGSDLDQGAGRFYLQATVTDQTNHSESASLSLPVTQSSLVIEAIPEGGQFRPNVENILYVLTSYPDGTPAETTLNLNFYNNGQELSVESGPYGLAEVRFTPTDPWQELLIEASDAQGNKSEQEFFFDGQWQEETVLLRPDRPAYRVGETMNLTLLLGQAQEIASTSRTSTVYLDMVREGQTVSTRAIQVSDGQAQVAVDLTPDLYGTLELHAYKILRSGTMTRDTRLVLVDDANDLALSFATDRDLYRPGETAALDIQVNGQDGSGAQSAVGLAIVDESLFALAEQDPGFAKLYFMLEQQLLQPKYDLHGFSIPDLLTSEPVDDPSLRAAQETTAQAALAEAVPVSDRFTLRANSHEDNIENIRLQQVAYFTRLSQGLFGLLLLLPMSVLALIVWELRDKEQFRRSLGLALGVVGLLTLLFFWWPVPEWADAPLDRVGFLLEALFELGEAFGWLLLLFGLVCFLGLIWYAWKQRERALGWALFSLPLLVALLIMTALATSEANIYPDESVVMWGFLAFLLLPLSFLIRAAVFIFTRHRLLALAAVGVAWFTFSTPLSALMGGLMMSGGFGAGAPIPNMGVDQEVMMAQAAMAEDGMAFDEAEEEPAMEDKSAEGADRAESSGEPPRLRQYFPETMLWVPDGVTDQNGLLSLEVPVADSITTWRLSALASTQDGRLGSATGSLRVFQDFFIDLDLPLALTVGDEIAVPVGIFNYLPETQTVRLELETMHWFELLDEANKEIEIEANDISVVYFRIRAQAFGKQPFKVTALGSQMSDAIQKEVQVFPDGKEIRFTESDRLTAEEPGAQDFESTGHLVSIPSDAIAGTQGLTVKIYPGMISQVVEGLDGMLRMPYGCFEQTSSTTYPNVLVLDYLQSTNQAAPEVEFKAEEYINLGYQRLTTFEVSSSGGFSLFGDPPPDRMLTAYGLQEFGDMSRVHSVDPDLVQRAAFWLLSEQKSDGSWENDQGLVHESTWSNLENDSLPVTAYIVWSLADAGFVNEAGTERGIDYVREFQGQAKDPYVVALVANALVAADLASGNEIPPSTQAVLDRLAALAERSGNGATWASGVATFMGSEGQTGSIETSALAALAFLRSNTHPDLANAALTSLIQQKDSFGTWYSTQATVLTLKSLIESVRAGSENVNATVTITLNGGQQRTVEVTPENFDVVQLISFDDVRLGQNVVSIEVEGEGNLMYQIAGNYYLPWDVLPKYPQLVEQKEPLTVDVTYDRTELSVDDTLNVNVSVSLNEPGSRVEWGLIDLGIPPGFTVQSEDLAALVERYKGVTDEEAPTIERYELTGRQILVYIGNLSYDNPISFSYRLKAKFPLVAQTPASNAYDYYNPDVAGVREPQTLVVQQ